MQLILYRGLPGSGKDYVIRKAFAGYNHFCFHIYSADSFRYVDGVYKFDPKTDTAHQQCFRTLMDDLSDLSDYESDFIFVINNTNSSAWEIAPYMLAAAAHDIPAEIRIIYCDPLV